jgi:hypothetical protein
MYYLSKELYFPLLMLILGDHCLGGDLSSERLQLAYQAVFFRGLKTAYVVVTTTRMVIYF